MVGAEQNANPTSGGDGVAEQCGVEEGLVKEPVGQRVALEDGIEVGANGGWGKKDGASDVVRSGE